MTSLLQHPLDQGNQATMLIVHEIAADESLMIGEKRFLKDPVMIVILQTKALENDMVHFDLPLKRVELIRGRFFQANQMQKVKLTAIVINSDTVDEAQKAGQNLWEEARTKFTMILLSPEELKSKEFSNLLESSAGLVNEGKRLLSTHHFLHAGIVISEG